MSSTSSTTAAGSTGAGGGNTIRLTGLATGLDVDSLVTKMLKAEQTKIDKAQQDQQVTTWKQTAYQDIITKIKDLQSSFFDSTDSSKNILAVSNYSPYTATGADTSVASLTAGAGATAGTYKVDVTNLASGAGLSNTLSGMSLTTKLTDIDASLTGSISMVLNAGGSSSDITINLDNSGGAKTLGDLINSINNNSSGYLKASFSELTGAVNLNTKATGASTSLTIKSGTTSALSSIFGSGTSAFGTDSGGVTTTDGTAQSNGKDASLSITPPGGTAVAITKSTNNFTIDGISYNLSGAGSTTVTVGADVDQVYDKINSFITKYNTLVDGIQALLTEKKDSKYPALTDAQKADMSDTQIAAWEKKAKVGILRNDENLSAMLDSLQSAFTTAVSNTGLSIGNYGSKSFGIDTSSKYSTPYHIDITDASKLKEAISSNCDQILKIFTNVSSSTDTSAYDSNNTKFKEDGIFTRISSILTSNVGYTNTTLNSAILTAYANKQNDYSTTGYGSISSKNTLPDQLNEQNQLIKKLKTEYDDKKEKYYLQFSKLESAMNTLNSQQSMLSSMMGSSA